MTREGWTSTRPCDHPSTTWMKAGSSLRRVSLQLTHPDCRQAVDAGRGGRYFSTAREAVDVFNGRSLLSTPGERYSYSSWGYTLLSAVVEQAAGIPFESYVAREIVSGLAIVPDSDPAGPTDTHAYAIEAGQVVRAPMHDFSYSLGGAGFRASATDIALFGDRVMAPGFLSNEAREAMWSPTTTTNGDIVTERDYPVAFGWRVSKSIDGQRMAHHAGVSIGARSALLVYPDDHMSVSLLSNASWTASIERTAEMIAAPFRDVQHPQAGRAACPVGATGFSGRFAQTPVAGTARFWLEAGLCRGSLSADNALGIWLNSFPQRDALTLEIIALQANARLDRGAFVSPIGAFELRAQPDGTFQVEFGGERKLAVSFQPAGPSSLSRISQDGR